RYRYAHVELFAELPQGDYEDVGDAIQVAIRANPEARAEAVRQILDQLDSVTCERVLFPGWTLVGATVPQWVVDRSRGRTLVVEMLLTTASRKRKASTGVSDGRWRAYVIRDGRVLVGPVFQLFYSGSQVGERGNPSRAAITLAA